MEIAFIVNTSKRIEAEISRIVFPKSLISFPASFVAHIKPATKAENIPTVITPLVSSPGLSLEIVFIAIDRSNIANDNFIRVALIISTFGPAKFIAAINAPTKIVRIPRETAPFSISSHDILERSFIALDKISKDAAKERIRNPRPLTFTESLMSIFDTAKVRAARTAEIAAIAPTDSHKEPESNLAKI